MSNDETGMFEPIRVGDIWKIRGNPDGGYIAGMFKTLEDAKQYLNGSGAVLKPQNGQKYYTYQELDDLISPIHDWQQDDSKCRQVYETSRLFKTKSEAEVAQGAERARTQQGR